MDSNSSSMEVFSSSTSLFAPPPDDDDDDSDMAAMEVVVAVVAPLSATAVEFDSRGLLPPSSCCVAEPSEDTPGGASHLHLQRRRTAKEGNGG
jgi:hypothetical protein